MRRPRSDMGKPKIIADAPRTSTSPAVNSGSAASVSAQRRPCAAERVERGAKRRPCRGGADAVLVVERVPECRSPRGSRARAAARRYTASRNASSFSRCAFSSCGIRLPDERARRPLRADERILAADEIDIASATAGGRMRPASTNGITSSVSRPRTDRLAGVRHVAVQPLIERAGGNALGYRAANRFVAVGPRVEQRRQRAVRIAEQRRSAAAVARATRRRTARARASSSSRFAHQSAGVRRESRETRNSARAAGAVAATRALHACRPRARPTGIRG